MDPWYRHELVAQVGNEQGGGGGSGSGSGGGAESSRKNVCRWPGKWGRRAEVVVDESVVAKEVDVKMDEALWGELHRYIDMEMVAAQLPVHAFYRARGVCKKWNSLPWNRAFLQQHSRTWLPKPYFILHGEQGCHQAMLVKDEVAENWVLKPLPAFAFQHDSTSVANGVVCTCETDMTFDREGCVVRGTVFNIHTKVFRRLPPLTVERAGDFDCSKLAVDTRSGDYKVLVACGSRQVLVYDSVTGRWTKRAASPVSLFLEEDATHCEGVMYVKWGGKHREPARPRPRIFGPPPPPVLSEPKVYAYNFKDDVWTVLPVAPPALLRTEQNSVTMSVKGLGEWRGVLRDVTFDGADNVLRVWELEQSSQEWTEVDRMPASVLDWFIDPNASSFKSGLYRKIIKTSYCEHYILMWNYGFAQTPGLARLVLYDMALKSWETLNVAKDWVCSCPFGKG
ncbi:hypothetical protein KC19_10G088000 [Ceratodon purpureus]|uniref:F-box domain-containing protein n=1 Tax=Ceratodon purpureus TaxID=3225 RepID=A0A8T0GN92_CERPU|nr:hypothetical protein KC19_10G088000 [Ceratodon purpureus]